MTVLNLPKLYDVEQLAEYLGCTPRWIREQVRLGRLGCYRLLMRQLEHYAAKPVERLGDAAAKHMRRLGAEK